ncbi:hypothetical protein [Nocardioides nitrophenolicus]|uniref:hypothetical protein n=1 Tax=Nocardioides nitrophenolicus TaxID=60489 RepID=UPI00195ED6E7|nr:hypothetical protein [Nocardioides nitrophenolicus]MBM7519413.1 hypothetical protein [Nocardioides nitrophenolicus]
MTDVPADFLNSMGTGPSPFGDLTPSARQRRAISFDTADACTNLLVKAATALRNGDEVAAQRFVHRAASKPFDRREGAWPALYAAHMMIFNLVVDALEGSAQDDDSWLDVCLAVLERTEGTARDEMRRVLAIVGSDCELTRREHDRLTSALGTAPLVHWDEDAQLDEEQVARLAASIVGLCLAFIDEAEAAGLALPM